MDTPIESTKEIKNGAEIGKYEGKELVTFSKAKLAYEKRQKDSHPCTGTEER